MTEISILLWLEKLLAERYGVALHLENELDAVCISLSETGEKGLWISRLPQLYENGSVGQGVCLSWDGHNEGIQAVLEWPMPAPCANSLVAPLVEHISDGYRIHYDILGLTYWMLARKEEVGNTKRDAHDRFPASASHAHKHGYLQRPIVDEWLNVLGQIIKWKWPLLALTPHSPSVRVSHDVDSPSRYGFRTLPALLRGMAGDVLRRRDFRGAAWAPWIRFNSRSRLHPMDPHNTFDWIMRTSETHGLKSAFYFICGRTNPRLDADYELSHPAICKLLSTIHARGHEIGLHASYDSYRNPEAVEKEIQHLRQVTAANGIVQTDWGGRMHYLRWTQPATLRVLERAGLNYDSTLGYADQPGFRCGTCFEYQAIDPVTNETLRLRIRPLIAMDVTVLEAPYLELGLTPSALALFEGLKQTCFRVGGVFELLWHNSTLTWPEQRLLFTRIIAS